MCQVLWRGAIETRAGFRTALYGFWIATSLRSSR
jgi:hypothetical protein